MFYMHNFPSESFVDLTMYQFGQRECHPNHDAPLVKHRHYLFHYVFSGKGVLEIEHDGVMLPFTVEQGQGFLIFPGHFNRYKADEENPWHYAWVEFDGLKARDLVKRTGLKANAPIYTSSDMNETSRMVNALSNIINRPTGDPIELMSFFYMFMNCFIYSSESRSQNQNSIGRMQDFYVQEAINYIQQNYYNDISIKDIASHCNIHRSYLSRIFKVGLDITPQLFLIRHRIEVACELLRTTKHSVGEISRMVGYPNQLNFSRTFRREMGVSPQQWRK